MVVYGLALNGVPQWGPGNPGTMTISFWEHDDELAPQLIARAHIEADFDLVWLRQEVALACVREHILFRVSTHAPPWRS